MQRFFSRTVVIAVLAFILGGLSVWGGNKLWDHYHPDSALPPSFALNEGQDLPNFDDFFNRDFFRQSRDPFKEMERMQREMMRNFGNLESDSDHFGSWFQKNFGGGSPSEFNTREDGDFVYYEIESSEGLPKKVDVKVEEGQVTISGEIERQDSSQGSSSKFSSTFVRSFPAPENVDAAKFQIEHQDKKIVIRFPKVKEKSSPDSSESSV